MINSAQSEIIKDALDTFPNTPTKTIANLVYKNNPEVFLTPESTRSSVRYYRGQNGGAARKSIKDKSYFSKGELCPFDSLPEGIKHFSDWSEHIITGKKILILADIHIPYHDKQALVTALEYGKAQNVDTILLLGDIIDFHSVSFYEKDPRKRMELKMEIDQMKFFLRTLRSNFPEAEIIYKIGNHEERLERFVRVKAPELLELEILNIEQLIDAERYDIDMVKDKRIVKIASLNCIHGHEFGGGSGSPVSPSRGLYLKGKETAICAHFHRSSEYKTQTLTGDIIGCWSIGTLGDLHPDYRPINEWNHGFAVVDRLNDKEFIVNNKTVYQGKVY